MKYIDICGHSFFQGTHIRNEGDGILLALQEVISVAEELQIPLHVSHMKCIGRKNWGGTPVKILKLFDQAAERGVKVDFDLYPYLTGSTQQDSISFISDMGGNGNVRPLQGLQCFHKPISVISEMKEMESCWLCRK